MRTDVTVTQWVKDIHSSRDDYYRTTAKCILSTVFKIKLNTKIKKIKNNPYYSLFLDLLAKPMTGGSVL